LYGFTLLFEKIWNSGKTLVGHNCFFDILFLYDAFIGALPYDYQLFKKAVTEVKSNNGIVGSGEKMDI
jgi:poly(A)-specific ribonuclease